MLVQKLSKKCKQKGRDVGRKGEGEREEGRKRQQRRKGEKEGDIVFLDSDLQTMFNQLKSALNSQNKK